ncbi:MAG: hypothetical protein MSQ05_01275 [Akkermansia sp.]|nr:hypothetical protein [Akkermansia sp.]
MVAGIPEAVAGYTSTGGGVYLRGPYDLRRVVCTGGPCGVIACPACHGAGVPEAGAGVCLRRWVVCLRAHDLRRRGWYTCGALRCACLPCLPWCGHSGGCSRARLSGGGVHLRGA